MLNFVSLGRTVYADQRLWRIFLLGLASGFPWLLIGGAMTAWLADTNYSRSAIGLFGIVFGVYTVNFLWAPLVDHFRLPYFERFGLRKSWILLCLSLLTVLALLLSLTGPAVDLFTTALLCFCIAIVSATQDLAIDAYRVTVIKHTEEHLLGHAAAAATCGWWVGLSLPGMFAFILADTIGWNMVYLMLAGLFLCLLGAVSLLVSEPSQQALIDREPYQNFLKFFDYSYVEAVAEFFRRNGRNLAVGLLLFIFLFKLGEAFLGRMVILFYKEVGFTNADIGIYSQGLNLVITLSCALLAGQFTSKFGTLRGLMIAGILMASTNLIFAWLAAIGPDKTILVFALVADGITTALSTVAFVAFITMFTSHLHAATQYGALASLGNSGRTVLAASSGFVVDALGGDWTSFFVLTAFMVLPSLLILWWLTRRTRSTV